MTTLPGKPKYEKREFQPDTGFRPHIVDLPDIQADLNKHEWVQRGNMLTCKDNPMLSAAIPHNMSLVGEKGNYKIVKDEPQR